MSIVLELYKLSVEMADRTTARRAGANTFFFSLNAGLAALVSIITAARVAPAKGTLPAFDRLGLVTLALTGLILAATWWLLLRYYRRLNGAKFDVINRIEEWFPIAPFTDEWAVLHPDEELPSKDGKQRRVNFFVRNKHREASIVEQVVPFVFAAIYLILGIRALCQ